MALTFQYITRFAVAFIAFAAVLFLANMVLHGGDPNAAVGRAVVGGTIGAVVVTVYLRLRARIRGAISSMGQGETLAAEARPEDRATMGFDRNAGEKE